MIVKFEPIAVRKIWGGNNLSSMYHIQSNNIGEIWGISAHKSQSNIITNTLYKGTTFRDFYRQNKQFFGYYSKAEFPLLFKIIDASENLSIQVHPQDDYALKHENSYGKTECWYILNTKHETEQIIIGHNFQNKEDLLNSLENQNIEEKLQYHTIKKNDYFYIPAGKVHAICKDTTLLELSQSSDVTYRLYDYMRLENGKPRTLHINKSLDVIPFPDTALITKHVDSLFTFNILTSNDEEQIADIYGDYIYIIAGDGHINNEDITKGDFMMITSKERYHLKGQIKYALIHIK